MKNKIIYFIPLVLIMMFMIAPYKVSAVETNICSSVVTSIKSNCIHIPDGSAAENCYNSRFNDFESSSYNKCISGISNIDNVITMYNRAGTACYSSSDCSRYSACQSAKYSISSCYSSSKLSGSSSISGDYELEDWYNSDSACSNQGFAKGVKVVGKMISIIQIIVPILLVIMGLTDLTKAIISQDDSKSRKAINIFIKRLISSIIIFFIVAIIRLICGLIGGESLDSNCFNLISNPWI